ncbi:MAG: hypothetical protein OEL87_00055 [Nanoarchaeota archaeon]|nr:hypothetical protein [Nanoarchaeota archaeon]
MEKCKVIGCNSVVMDECINKYRHPSMRGRYGYCQKHMIEGLVEAIND